VVYLSLTCRFLVSAVSIITTTVCPPFAATVSAETMAFLITDHRLTPALLGFRETELELEFDLEKPLLLEAPVGEAGDKGESSGGRGEAGKEVLSLASPFFFFCSFSDFQGNVIN
jgi:hypothetical protein